MLGVGTGNICIYRCGQHFSHHFLILRCNSHQRHRAVLLIVVKEERAVRKTADQVVAPVLPYEPVFPHAGIIPKILGLYQQCCINTL